MTEYSASDISKAVSLAVIFVITVVGNALMVYVLLKFRRHLLRNRPTYQFILNIVVSDLTVGLLTMPFEFVRELLDEWIFGTAACKIIEFVEIAVSGTAVFSHALIAFDRYRNLTRPYLPKLDARLVRKLIILSWLVPSLVTSPYLYLFEVQEIDSMIMCTPRAIPSKWLDKLYEAIEFVAVLLIPFLVLCWCYFHVTMIMWGRSPLVAADNMVTSRHSVIFQHKKRVTRTAGLVAIAFVVCWLPTFILSFIRIVSGTDHVHRRHILHEIAMFGTFINEAINPIIYCAFDRNIKARIAICTRSVDIAGSAGNDPYQTHNTANDNGQNEMSFRTLDLSISTNRPR